MTNRRVLFVCVPELEKVVLKTKKRIRKKWYLPLGVAAEDRSPGWLQGGPPRAGRWLAALNLAHWTAHLSPKHREPLKGPEHLLRYICDIIEGRLGGGAREDTSGPVKSMFYQFPLWVHGKGVEMWRGRLS